jgi:hypothetical protein
VYNEALSRRRLKPVDQWPEALQAIRRKVPIEPAMLDEKFLKHFCDTLKIPARTS